MVAITSFAARETGPYRNFELPRAGGATPSASVGKHHIAKKILVKNEVRLQAPTIDHKKFLFAKEAFLAEKREEAIKLLRQQMDSGLKINRENMLLRLGQLYAEKYMELSYQETEVYTAKLAEYERKKAAGQRVAAPKADTSRSKKYLKDALKLFYELERKFPSHPKIDEILFFIGFVEMEGGNRPKGARYLEKVVSRFPQSRKFEEAVIYLADFYFDKSRFKEAHEKYRILVRQKSSPMHHYAVYKAAWCDLNTMHGEQALRDMKRLVKDLEGAKDPAKFNLREQALRDLVVFYGDAGSIDEAMVFFTDTLGKEKAVQNLRLIADIMRSKARDGEAIRAYQRLMREMPNTKESPLVQLGIYESLQRMNRTAQAVESLVWALDHYGPKSDWADDFRGDKEELTTMLKTLEEEGARAAFFYHSSAQKGSNKALYTYALTLYEALLRNYPQHADRKKFLFYRGEVLYGQKKWLDAADSYMEASKNHPKDKLTDEAVYNALLALDQLTARVDKIERYSEEEQRKMDLTPKDIPKGEQRFIEIAEMYRQEYPRGARIVDVQYRIAAIYYRYRHFDRALQLFSKIALEHPKHRSATTAAYIVLDVINIQKDYDKLDSTAALFARTPGLGDAKFKAEMKEISGTIGFKQVEKLEADNQWKKAAESYLSVYKSDPSGTLAEKALYNALVSYEKANEPGRAQEVTKVFISKYPRSRFTEQLMLSMARNAEKMYDFDEAQKLYFDFYRNQPKSKEARKALYNSAVFAELLERNGAAIERYDEYLRTGRVSLEEGRAIQISIAKLHRRQGNWGMFARIYRQLINDAPRMEDKLAYMAELARQYELAGRTSEKMGTIREIRAMYNGAGRPSKNSGRAPYYAAEAEFYTVFEQRKKYDQTEIRFPVQDLVYLVGLKQRRLKNLGQAYDKVIEIGVPEWGVAALHDKAEAFAAYGVAFRRVEIPKKMKGAERQEAEIGLKKIEAEIVVALDRQAEETYKLCVSRATEYHVATDYAGRCRMRAKSSEVVEPQGSVPVAAVWGERFKAWSGAAPSFDDKGRALEYIASLAVGRGDGAEKKIKEYLALYPSEKRALFLLAVYYYRHRKVELAQFFFNQLEKDSDFEWRSMLFNNLGLMALADHNRALAIDYFEKAMRSGPTIGAPFANLGALYIQSRSFSDAEHVFRRALSAEPYLEDAALGLGVALEGQGKFEAAHEVYASFLGDNTNALSVLYNDAILLGNRLGQREKAAQQMLRYIQSGGKESAKAQETMRNWR